MSIQSSITETRPLKNFVKAKFMGKDRDQDHMQTLQNAVILGHLLQGKASKWCIRPQSTKNAAKIKV